jgi:hypothetical protein
VRRLVAILPHRNQYVQTLIAGNNDLRLESCGSGRQAGGDMLDLPEIAKKRCCR